MRFRRLWMEGRAEKQLILSGQVRPKLLCCGGKGPGQEGPETRARLQLCAGVAQPVLPPPRGLPQHPAPGRDVPRERWEDGGPRCLGNDPCAGTSTTQLPAPKPGADTTVPGPCRAMEMRGWARAGAPVAARGAEGPSRGCWEEA